MAEPGLVHGPVSNHALHICVDMQNLFAPEGPWAVPWAERVLPAIEELSAKHARRTVFTRFIPARHPGEAPGMWARYYRRWADVTLERIDPTLVELVPSLARFVPPASVLDKRVYSPWTEGGLDALLRGSRMDTLVITGGETDMCVLATVLGSVDRGYRTILVADAICSSADDTHDALMEVYTSRFSEQLEVVLTQDLLENWPEG